MNATTTTLRRFRVTAASARNTGIVRQRISMGSQSELLARNSTSYGLDRGFIYNMTTSNFHTSAIDSRPTSTTTATTTPLLPTSNNKHYYSTTTYNAEEARSKYVVIDHSEAYETAMKGRHGQQLALAKLEGMGKDDPPFDPFLEEELLLAQQQQAINDIAEDGKENNNDNDDNDDGYDADMSEDEFDDFAEDDDEDDLSPYNPDGSLRRKKSVLATLRAGYPSGGFFAVFELAGTQHKVTTDDLIVANKLKPVDKYKIGSVHTLNDIMLVGSSHLTLVGLPYVPGAEVDVMVEEITRDAKVIVFKKRRRKNSQRKNGFRRDLTLLRVLDVRLPEEYKDHQYVTRDSILDDLDTDNNNKTVVNNKPTQKNKEESKKQIITAEDEEQQLKSA